jgi:hypothetical protein
MSGLGHNNGPTMEAGFAFRKHAWTKARAALIPTLPIEILRTRVARAKAIGLPYKTYASVRASMGRDVVGFLFYNNALRVIAHAQSLPEDRAKKLSQVDAFKLALAHAPITLEHLCLDAIGPAPHFAENWSDIRSKVQAPIRALQLPREGVLVIGDTTSEREWSEAGRLAGYIPSVQFFGSQ